LSKWCGAGGWRLGTFSFPKELAWLNEAMAIVASETYTSTSAPIQYAAVKAFEGGPFIDEYLSKTRRILRYLAKITQSSLAQNQIYSPPAQGGFYIYPNFSAYRSRLAEKGILTSDELCEAILNETGVAMLPGIDFGHQPEELLARLAYVDFDGKAALDALDKDYVNDKLNEKFIQHHCPNIHEGIDRLINWIVSV